MQKEHLESGPCRGQSVRQEESLQEAPAAGMLTHSFFAPFLKVTFIIKVQYKICFPIQKYI